MSSETAVDMANLIVKFLRENNLAPSKMICFTADNTDANFGGAERRGNNNVFAILKKVYYFN
jgi:hypothetical protein